MNFLVSVEAMSTIELLVQVSHKCYLVGNAISHLPASYFFAQVWSISSVSFAMSVEAPNMTETLSKVWLPSKV